MKNLLDDLINILSQDDRLVSEGKLMKNKIVELAMNLDSAVIRPLLNSPALKAHFFKNIDGILVFDKIKFQQFVSNKSFLPDSFTSYKNKIGLIANGEYLTESKEVVLAWPYKDCVLEGGQDKEDARRNEVFWNETLAPDQIDRLLSPKVLTNFKRYDKDGDHPVAELSLNNNLIIKGNNLLALHTLRKVYAGKVKLIYIDPPFNTENDSFRYNDSFNHATWMTFMKNRLEAAKALLGDGGLIFVQLDDRETAYCKVLMDEIFGRDNFLSQIVCSTNSSFGFKSTSDGLFKQSNVILLYSKTQKAGLRRLYVEKDYDPAYKYIFDDIALPEKTWSWRLISDVVAEVMSFDTPKKARLELGEEAFLAAIGAFAIENAERVFRTASVTGGAFAKRKLTIAESKLQKDEVIRHPNDDMNYQFIGGERVLFYKERLVDIDGLKLPGKILTDIWTDISIEGISNEGGIDFPRAKKPEALIKRIIELATESGDIVLDFFAGSGTTAAVAHKMGRRYIGVEQMDYIEAVTLERLKKVIAGEQGGISKAVNWQGGGSFVYCELSQANQEFIDQIQAAKSSEELQAIWQTMQEHAFLSYKLDPKTFDANKSEFASLAFADQQRFLVEMLDKNLLYMPYSEIDDASYAVSEEDKKLNRQFFNL